MVYELDESVHVDASPEAVYALVSDVPRTGEWSVQCRSAEWDGPERGVGATFTGHNAKPGREWTTTSRVVIADPGREFGWTVVPAGVRWGFRMAAQDGGTELTQYTSFDESAEAFFGRRFGASAEEEIRIRHEAARTGMAQTLAAIKRIVEGAADPQGA